LGSVNIGEKEKRAKTFTVTSPLGPCDQRDVVYCLNAEAHIAPVVSLSSAILAFFVGMFGAFFAFGRKKGAKRVRKVRPKVVRNKAF
jgi:hypothetical protein